MKETILFLLLLIFIIGCAEQLEEKQKIEDFRSSRYGHLEELKEKIISSEQIGDNAEILTIEGTYEDRNYERTDIIYEKDGREFQNYFAPQFRNALDWIKENTEEAVFLSWWDYGHMIRGYSEGDVVIYAPSEDILWSLAIGRWNETMSGEFSSREKIDDVVLALTTTDTDKTREIMKKYHTDYVFVTTRDAATSFVLFKIAGFDLEEYIDESFKPKEKALSAILFRMINEEEIKGFELVYDDDLVRIYKLK